MDATDVSAMLMGNSLAQPWTVVLCAFMGPKLFQKAPTSLLKMDATLAGVMEEVR